MRLALLSDLHANRQALDACLAHAQAAGAERHAFLGDLVGYGGDPAYVVQRVMDMAEQGALVVKGNHDHYTVEASVSGKTLGQMGIDWTREQLSDAQRRFLAELPLTAITGNVLLVHASAAAPAAWHYVENPMLAALSLDAACEAPTGSPDVHYVFGGHVHRQTLYYRGGTGKLMPFAPTPGVPIPVPRHRRWLATVGSVGQPRDGRAEAMYALFDDAAQQLTFHRVAYDVQAAASAIRATPMPPFFAQRLEGGQ